MNKKDVFIEAVCSNVKYRSVRSKIRTGLLSKKDDFFSEKANNADKAASEINKYHHMPFNCKYGLIIWAAIVTAFIYAIYPILYIISSGSLSIAYKNLSVIGIILFMGIINYLFLKRGHFKFSFIDVLDVTVGFLIGAILSVGLLFAVSSIGKYGYYPYFNDVKILFFNSIPFFGGKLRICGDEFMIWCFCMLIYMLSIKPTAKATGFSFAANLDASDVYRINTNDTIN